jgi:AmmeMemoRadiSam system protein A
MAQGYPVRRAGANDQEVAMDQERTLTLEEQKELLGIARRAVEQSAQGRSLPTESSQSEGLEFERGAFVTLHKSGRLRGCIGNFSAEGPLLNTVQTMALAAAKQDPRFPPVSPSEVPELELEISVLSPLKKIEDVGEIQVGVHGIYIISPRGRGVLLPQVATEYGWDRDTFLDQTCVKAGLNPGCWQDPRTEILIFSAQIFSEKDLMIQD